MYHCASHETKFQHVIWFDHNQMTHVLNRRHTLTLFYDDGLTQGNLMATKRQYMSTVSLDS
jgi:hypothetical protein